MNHSELHIIDLCIIGAYLITMVLVGVYCVKRVKNTGDYYVAGPVSGTACADGYSLCHNHWWQRPYGPGRRGVFQWV